MIGTKVWIKQGNSEWVTGKLRECNEDFCIVRVDGENKKIEDWRKLNNEEDYNKYFRKKK